MPANTPRGFPYPLPPEPVAEGAQAIRNLAEAVDASRDEFAYAEVTAPVTVGTGGVVVVASGVKTYQAIPIKIEFFAPLVDKGPGAQMQIFLYDGATQIGLLGWVSSPAVPITLSRRITPTAGSHNYTIQAVVPSGSGGISGGTGSGNALVPIYIRVSRA